MRRRARPRAAMRAHASFSTTALASVIYANAGYVRYSPIVEMKVELYASSENRNRMHVFPTPESPIKSSLNR